MLDGIYQSLICFFMVYLLFAPATAVTANGLLVNDRKRMGVYVACATIVVVNVYILLNTYRWDWLMLLLVSISILLIWFWTGVYTAFQSSSDFYKAAPQVYSNVSFWALTLLTVVICLVPRFTIKAFQKVFVPLDVDIVREQIRQGKFRYLDDKQLELGSDKALSTASLTVSGNVEPGTVKSRIPLHANPLDDDTRPIYPPSVAQTATTHNNRSQNGSDGTDYTGHGASLDQSSRPISRGESPINTPFNGPLARPISTDRPRPSFDRMRQSMDRVRPSFEASNDFTSAARLSRVESSHSDIPSRRLFHANSSLR